MKVLHVIADLAARTGGPPVGTVGLARALNACGGQASIYTTDLATAASAARPRAGIATADMVEGAASLDVRIFRAIQPHRIAFSPGLAAALARDVPRFDIVHIHSLFLFPQFAAYIVASRAHVPYIVSPHGALDPHLRSRHPRLKALVDRIWQKRMLVGAAALHMTTEEESRLTADLGLPTRHYIGPYGIDTHLFGQDNDGKGFRRRYLDGFSGPLIMCHGRLAEKKGLDILIRALPLVRLKHPTAMLALVGPDDSGLTPDLTELAKSVGAVDAVRFIGMLRGASLRDALAAADVWALPSSTENFGIAVIEALATGLATIITPFVNIAVDLRRAEAGLVCERTPERFAAEINLLLADAESRAALGRRAKTFAQRYDWSLVGKQLIHLYDEVVLSTPSGRGQQRRRGV